MTTHILHSRRLPLAVLVAFSTLLAAAPTGRAAVMTLGSDLSRPADTVEDRPADTAFWNVTVGGAPAAMPDSGQVTLARIRGSVLDDPAEPRNPDPQFHLQVLHPTGSDVTVALSSAPFRLPIGDVQTISDYAPVNLCVSKGDYVDFNDIGGFEWRWNNYRGMAVRVFSRPATAPPPASLASYTKSNGTNIGAHFAPQSVVQGEELLMQTRLATGPDATDLCPGGYREHVFHGLTVDQQAETLATASRTTTLHAECPFATYGDCRGTLELAATIAGSKFALGQATFDVPHGTTAKIPVVVPASALKPIQKARVVTARATVSAHDDPAADKRAARNKPPQQSAVTTAAVTLRPDKLPKRKDGDGDGMPDAFEKKYGLDPKSKKDAKKDRDRDGLTNLAEYRDGSSPRKADTDGDGISDSAEMSDQTNPADAGSRRPPDQDGDGVPDASDNCRAAKNPTQSNIDGDAQGDACDADDDNDGRLDGMDNCPAVSNPGQENNEHDTQGDVCDTDDDNDLALDGADNCPLQANANQADRDQDGKGDVCDEDDDGDGQPDATDNCPTLANPDQANADGDSQGDACDPNDDTDTVPDKTDNCDFTANQDQADRDGDGVGDACDSCPSDVNAGVDTDGDGIDNACDDDDDGDGSSDIVEIAAGTDPLDPADHP